MTKRTIEATREAYPTYSGDDLVPDTLYEVSDDKRNAVLRTGDIVLVVPEFMDDLYNTAFRRKRIVVLNRSADSVVAGHSTGPGFRKLPLGYKVTIQQS